MLLVRLSMAPIVRRSFTESFLTTRMQISTGTRFIELQDFITIALVPKSEGLITQEPVCYFIDARGDNVTDRLASPFIHESIIKSHYIR